MLHDNPFSSEKKLQKALLRGNQKAWDYLVKHFSPLILSTLYSLLKKEYAEDAHDILQEIFAYLCERDCRVLQSFDSEKAQFATWLVVITKSRCIDWLRKKRLALTALEDDQDIPINDPEPIEPINYPKELFSEREKTIMILNFDYEMTVKEIAVYLNIEEQTVRSTRHKAITKLRDYYQKNEKK